MIPTVAVALALAVLMHVAWNLAARQSGPDSRFLWWALTAYLVCFGPWSLALLVAEARWSYKLVLYLAITALANAAYFLFLGNAYRYAPIPLVYPIARSAPLWIALWYALFFGERLSLLGWCGLVISVGGILVLAATARGGTPAKALPWAVAAALATSVYSTSGKLAVPDLPSYAAQLGFVSVAFAVSWMALTLQHRLESARWWPRHRPRRWHWLIGGIFIGNAYALVIYAMQFIPAAYAVAFTNAGIVLAGLIAMTVFKEREHWRARLAAMLVICLGLWALALA